MRIKYITLNVWLGGLLFDNIAFFIQRENPDILSIQEVFNEKDITLERRFRTVSELQKATGFPHVTFSPALLLETKEGLRVEQGNAVFSKFPIRRTDVTFYDEKYKMEREGNSEEYPYYPRILQHATLDVLGKEINVFNTHGIWGEDGDDNPRRLKMSQTIIDHVKGKERVILSGDFNVNSHAQSIKNIGSVLRNVFEDELTTSFNMKHKTNGGYATAVVDFIFVSPDVNVLAHSMPNVDVSDHMPLIAELEV